MHNANGYPSNNGSSQSVTNWFKFFQEERELWVQNISATQLSIQFEVAPGHYAGVLVPIGPDPICITNEVPFDAVKKSLDFRKFLNRVPSVTKLLTTEQAHAYYAEKAKNLGAYLTDPATGQLVPNVAAAIGHTDLERKKLTTRPPGDDTVVGPDGQVRFSPPKTALELSFDNVGNQPVMMEQLIHPRVLYLCQQVSMQLQPNLRMPAGQFFREIQALRPQLNLESLQYIESNGTYQTVKKWAREQQQPLVAQDQGEGLEDGLEAPTPIESV